MEREKTVAVGNGRMIGELREFVLTAEKSGNYPPNTAGGMKAALKLVSTVLTDQEAATLDTFRDHLDQIFNRVFNKHKSKVTPVTLQTYKTRIRTLVSDYGKYGSNPSAWASWNRRTRSGSSKSTQNGSAKKGQPLEETPSISGASSSESGSSMNKLEVVLGPSEKAVLWIPATLSQDGVTKIKKLLDAFVVGS